MIKKLIIVLVVMIVILALILWLRPKQEEPLNNEVVVPEQQEPVYQAEFLNDAEKAKLNIPLETKVQALKKSPEGEVEVYKIITNDWDVVTDPSKIGPISPRQ